MTFPAFLSVVVEIRVPPAVDSEPFAMLSHITMTSQWAWWRLKSPASRLFTQPFIQAQIKENIKAPRHWPLWKGIHRWPVNFPSQKASNAENISIWWSHHVWNTCTSPRKTINCLPWSVNTMVANDQTNEGICSLDINSATQEYSTFKYRKVNSLRPKPNRRHFADDIFKCILENENGWMSPRISLKFVPKVRINNIPALVQIMAWRRPGDKPSSEPMMGNSLTTQWVNYHCPTNVIFSLVAAMEWPSTKFFLVCTLHQSQMHKNLGLGHFDKARSRGALRKMSTIQKFP